MFVSPNSSLLHFVVTKCTLSDKCFFAFICLKDVVSIDCSLFVALFGTHCDFPIASVTVFSPIFPYMHQDFCCRAKNYRLTHDGQDMPEGDLNNDETEGRSPYN